MTRYVLVMAATFGAFLGPFSGVLMAAAVSIVIIFVNVIIISTIIIFVLIFIINSSSTDMSVQVSGPDAKLYINAVTTLVFFVISLALVIRPSMRLTGFFHS